MQQDTERNDMSLSEKAIFDWKTCSAVRGKFPNVAGYHEFLVENGDIFRPKIQEPKTMEEKSLFDWKNDPTVQENFKSAAGYFDFLKSLESFDRNAKIQAEFNNDRTAYEAFLRAEAKGLVKVLGKKIKR